MSRDVVDRLRTIAASVYAEAGDVDIDGVPSTMHAAADEIERLRADLDGALGKHLPQSLFAEYVRLDMAWQSLIAERDSLRARVAELEGKK